MKFDYFEYRIASHYLPALVNGDYSGMDDADDFNNWLDTVDRRVTHWDVVDYGDNFTRCAVSGLHADCATVRAYFPE